MITSARYTDIPPIAALHIQNLSGDFLPSLGKEFLQAMYEGIIGKLGVYIFVDRDKAGISGFIIGTSDMNLFFKQVISSNFIKLLILLAFQIIKNPSIIRKIIETFFYPKKDIGPKAELVVVAVGKAYRGQGIGKKLVDSLEREFIKKGIFEYKLTVHADKDAVLFYEHTGMKRISSFQLYDKMWYVYGKNIKKKNDH